MFNKKEEIMLERLPSTIVENGCYVIKQNTPNSYTHGFFKYPCKFIPEIPRWAIGKYASNKNLPIFDPFAGSGTTLLESQILGYEAVGTEIDNVAKCVINAKTCLYTEKDLIEIKKEFELLSTKKIVKEVSYRPKINNLNHWFIEENIQILGMLKNEIEKISNKKVRNFFEVVFISIIKPVSNADNASPKPYVSNKIKKDIPNAKIKFIQTYQRYYKMVEDYVDLDLNKKIRILDGDALHVNDSFMSELAITSPPYINAFDYPRTLRLENLWLNTSSEENILKSKSRYVGTERFSLVEERKKTRDIFDKSKGLGDIFNQIHKKDEKRAYIVKKFFEDMEKNLKMVHNHLIEDGVYVIVIGDSNIRNVIIESWRILIDIAEAIGYTYENHFSYVIKNPYIRIPRKGRGGMIKEDHVLVLRKGKNG